MRRRVWIMAEHWDRFRAQVMGTAFGLPPEYGFLRVVDFQDECGPDERGRHTVQIVYQRVAPDLL